jgi:glycosyltransferase involved in cell wall biosynthesis
LPNDSDTLAEEIIKLLESPEKIREMGISDKKVINEKFTLSNMAKQTLSVYTKALSI